MVILSTVCTGFPPDFALFVENCRPVRTRTENPFSHARLAFILAARL